MASQVILTFKSYYIVKTFKLDGASICSISEFDKSVKSLDLRQLINKTSDALHFGPITTRVANVECREDMTMSLNQ